MHFCIYSILTTFFLRKVFGFVAMALFIADTAFYSMEYRSVSAGFGDDQTGITEHDETGIHQDRNRTDVEEIP